jgi:DNA (cytosine-5)-methyltransferase 1
VLKPRWIVVENVEHMRSWSKFDSWHKKIKSLGYKTLIAVIDSKDHRTPQSRKRLFILCDREKQPTLPLRARGRKRTVASVLGQGEYRDRPWEFQPVDTKRRAMATKKRAKRAIAALGPLKPFIMVYYGTDGAGGYQTLDRPLRTITTLDRFALVRMNCQGHEMRMLQPPQHRTESTRRFR